MKSQLTLPDLSRLCPLHKIYYLEPLRQSVLSQPTYISARHDHSCTIARPKTISTARQHYLLPEAVEDWNGLPNDIVTITDNA